MKIVPEVLRRMPVKFFLGTIAASLLPPYILAIFFGVPQPSRKVDVHTLSHVAMSWSDPTALERELIETRRGLGLNVAAFRADGTVAVPGVPAIASLSASERDRLTPGEVQELRDRCSHGACDLALGVEGTPGTGSGYLILAHHHTIADLPPHPVIALTFLLLLLNAALVGWTVARPLRRITRAVNAIGAGDLSARVDLRRGDEFGLLGRTFDDMAARVEVLVRGRTELLATVAHELRTPLARLRALLDGVTVAGDPLPQGLAEEVSELESLVFDLLTSARMDLSRDINGAAARRRVATDPDELLDRAADRFRLLWPGRQLDLAIEPDLPVIHIDPVLLRRALENLLDNARKYSPTGSVIRVSATRHGDMLEIQVEDQGSGLTGPERERLFQPFYRGSNAATVPGVGMGLALARRIAQAHDGTLEMVSARGVGTILKMMLPISSAK